MAAGGGLYFASIKWLKEQGLKPNDARRLANALCTLADYEGLLKRTLTDRGHSEVDHSHVCDALRYIVDGEEGAGDAKSA